MQSLSVWQKFPLVSEKDKFSYLWVANFQDPSI